MRRPESCRGNDCRQNGNPRRHGRGFEGRISDRLGPGLLTLSHRRLGSIIETKPGSSRLCESSAFGTCCQLLVTPTRLSEAGRVCCIRSIGFGLASPSTVIIRGRFSHSAATCEHFRFFACIADFGDQHDDAGRPGRARKPVLRRARRCRRTGFLAGPLAGRPGWLALRLQVLHTRNHRVTRRFALLIHRPGAYNDARPLNVSRLCEAADG
jgi:hypothetical protein